MLNNISLVGYIATNPKVIVMKTGKPVANFELQVRRNYKTADGKKVYDFLPCRVFTPSVIQYIEKFLPRNSEIAVIGKVQSEVYTDRNGNQQKSVYIWVDTAQAIKVSKFSVNNKHPLPLPADEPTDENENFASMGSADIESDPLAAVDW